MISDPFALAAERILPPVSQWVQDPYGWVQKKLDEFLWSKQREIMEAVRLYPRVAVKACHGPGKSFVASRIVGWWMDSHAPGTAKAITTAPTFPQVRTILWGEINVMFAKAMLIAELENAAGLLGHVNETEWKVGNQVVAQGRKPADYDQAAFQGFHALFLLVVLDEACGIPVSLWDAANTLVTNANGRLLAIGNPDDPNSHFAEVCKPDSGWHVITISLFDTPNFTEEWVPSYLREILPTQEYLDMALADWGIDSPLYISKVLGQFPEDAEDTVVPWSAVAACSVPKEEHDDTLPIDLGLDVGGGGDKTVLTARQGEKVLWQREKATPDTMVAVGLASQACKEVGARRINVDSIGIGMGVADRLKELRRDGEFTTTVHSINVSSSSSDSKKFPNLRDEIWWQARERSLRRQWDLSELSDKCKAELIAPRYDLDSKGRTKVEKKEETKKRLKRSPDGADSLNLAFYVPPDTGPMNSSSAAAIAAARI